MYKYIFLDLDGTITESENGILNSVEYALGKYGIKVEDRAPLYSFIGPPLIWSFENFYGFSHEKAEEAVQFYREYYGTRGIFENRMYDGIPETLKKLKDMGRSLVLATSKPDRFSVDILKHFGIYDMFDFIGAAAMDETRTTKEEVIAYALEGMKIKDVSEVLMVGDRKHDVLGAAAFGIDCAGVLYGYGSREELEQAGARYIIKTPEELPELVNKTECAGENKM